MKRLLVLAAAAAMLSVAAPVMASEAPAPAIASEDAERAEKLALAERYLTVIQGEKLMNVMMESMVGPMLEDERIPADKREVIREIALESFAVVIPQMMDASIVIYADAFTLEELRGLVAFYESPVGRSLMAKTLMLTQRSNELYGEFIPILQAEMMERMCARLGECGATGGVAPTAKR